MKGHVSKKKKIKKILILTVTCHLVVPGQENCMKGLKNLVARSDFIEMLLWLYK